VLLVRINVLKHLDVGFSESKPLTNLKKAVMVLSLGSGLSFCNGDLLPNFNKIVEYELLIMEFDNSKT
jgi:hypothetical protein